MQPGLKHLFIWGIVVSLCSVPLHAQSIVLTQKAHDQMRLDQVNVEVGDIFSVEAGNSQVSQQLRSLALIDFRKPGHTQKIYDFHLDRILAAAGYEEFEVKADFPVEVTSQRKILPVEYLSSKVSDYFRKNSDAEVTWNYTREPEIEIFPGEAYSLSFRHSGEILPGRMALRTELNNGGYSRDVSIMLDVSLRRKVLVATEHLPRGAALSKRNTRYEMKDVNIYEARNAVTSGKLDHMELIRAAEPGESILSNMIQRIEIIKPGDNVKLFVDTGILRVESLGTAIESAGISEKVKVRESGSGNVIVGVVVDNRTIKILPQENL